MIWILTILYFFILALISISKPVTIFVAILVAVFLIWIVILNQAYQSVFEKTLPESEFDELFDQANFMFRVKRYLKAMKIFEKLEQTRHGHEIRFCKKICQILLGDDEEIKDLYEEMYEYSKSQIKVPAHFYKKLIDCVSKNGTKYQNECFYFLVCFHR